MTFSFLSHSPKDTFFVGNQLGLLLQQPILITLDGDLGAGKTHFVQGLARGLGVQENPTSPTFAIMEEYEGRIPLLHVDLYRLEEADLEPLGLEEQLEVWDGVVAVEWSVRFPHVLPEKALTLVIHQEGDRRVQEGARVRPVEHRRGAQGQQAVRDKVRDD